MKKSRFTETQIIAILKEGEAGSKVKDICRSHGISDATYYNWKSKYGGMQASDLKRMKDMEHKLSISRGCACLNLSRTAYYQLPQIRSDKDVVTALNKMIAKHPRWGFWKCFRALRRVYSWNHKKVYRGYCNLRLNQKRRAKKRLPKRVKQPLVTPVQPNQTWSADCMSDSLYAGKRFRTFNVIDDFNRELLHIEIDTSITGRRLLRVFERLRYERGLPKTLRTDNGPEFLSGEFVAWAESVGMHIQYIQPGKPNQNAYIERFNKTYRTEVLNLYLFRNLTEVREITYWWKLTYNKERPHDALDGLTPSEFLSINAENSNFELSA